MLLAAEVFLWMRRRGFIASAEEHRAGGSRCLFCDYKEGPDFPKEEPKA